MSSGEDKIRLKIKELEFEYGRTQKNKATEGHLGLLKAKISKLRRELTEAASTGKKGGGAGERGFEVSKSGDTRVGLVGELSTPTGPTYIWNTLVHTVAIHS